MVIDCILDRKDGEDMNVKYDPHRFYCDILPYGEESEYITSAMDYGEEDDVKYRLCEYVMTHHYNPEICNYINSRNWL